MTALKSPKGGQVLVVISPIYGPGLPCTVMANNDQKIKTNKYYLLKQNKKGERKGVGGRQKIMQKTSILLI